MWGLMFQSLRSLIDILKNALWKKEFKGSWKSMFFKKFYNFSDSKNFY